MIAVIVIFTLTFGIVIYYSYLGVQINSRKTLSNNEFIWNKYYFISFILLALFLGTRYGVGRDFYSYMGAFSGIRSQFFKFGKTIEFGHVALTNLILAFKLGYRSYFIVTSTITVFLLFRSIKNNFRLLPTAILFFFLGGLFDFGINGIRQVIAMLALYNALLYVDWNGNKMFVFKNFLYYCFFIVIGVSFHYSILLFTPLFFLLHNRFLSLLNAKILFVIAISGFFIESFSISKNVIDFIFDNFPKYVNYALEFSNIENVEKARFGFANTSLFLANIFPIILYDKIKKEYPESRIFFFLFALGISFEIIFSQYLELRRISLYFLYCNIFVFAYIFQYLKKYYKNDAFYKMAFYFACCIFVFKFYYYLPNFMEKQILFDNFSLWFLPLSK